MRRNPYRAGAVKEMFWFAEFKKAVELAAGGFTWDDIRRMSEEDNVFGSSTPQRARQMYASLSARMQALDGTFVPVFLASAVATQKILALAAVLAHDTLFFDFVYDVVREKLILGADECTMKDWRVFFAEKARRDERAAAWTEGTVVRLGRSYRTMLREAGVLDRQWRLCRPVIDTAAERWMAGHGLEPVLKALTGVRS